jgi:predicted RNase H-like HicB family nuclease
VSNFTALYEQDGDWVIAYVEELPAANSQGRTLEDARQNLREAVELILLCNRESA